MTHNTNTYAIITKKNNKTSIIMKLGDEEDFNLRNPEYDYAAMVDVPDGLEWPKKFRSKRRLECYDDVYKFIQEMYDAEEYKET